MDRPPPQELLEFLAPYPSETVELYLEAREFLLSFAPEANEVIWDAANAVTLGLSFTDRWQDGFVHLPAYNNHINLGFNKHINLGFNRGAELHDPERRLIGTGSTVRHVRLNTMIFDDPYVRALIEQARDRAPNFGESRGTTTIRIMAGKKRRPC